ncbi:MAG: hypothetical protein K2I03_14355 [Lachnospiraceae bacterium]|nr:hypothetical protein [Lachnospiraceae bacterium]
MKIGKRLKVILFVLVFMSSFYVCMPILCAAAKTDVIARIEPISNKPADSDDNTDTDKKSPKDKSVVGTGDNLLRVCLLIMSMALSSSVIVILFLRYHKTED